VHRLQLVLSLFERRARGVAAGGDARRGEEFAPRPRASVAASGSHTAGWWVPGQSAGPVLERLGATGRWCRSEARRRGSSARGAEGVALCGTMRGCSGGVVAPAARSSETQVVVAAVAKNVVSERLVDERGHGRRGPGVLVCPVQPMVTLGRSRRSRTVGAARHLNVVFSCTPSPGGHDGDA